MRLESMAGISAGPGARGGGLLGQSGRTTMTFYDRLANSGTSLRCFCLVVLLIAAGSSLSRAKAEAFDGPTFRKGMWHFVRTLELVVNQKTRYQVLAREMTRCVDPTQDMRAIFSSPSIGNCVSAKPEKSDNQYTFSNRCDYMGPVSTVITVQSDESYTEVNELAVGKLAKSELVVARRVGDCGDGAQRSDRPPVPSH
jgi:hypothetical protein